MSRRPGRAAAVAAVVTGLLGCGPVVSPATAAAIAAHPRAGEIWGDKCGSCHVPVEPGTRTREALDVALAKHRARAKISEAEWGELVEFLAAAPPVPGGDAVTPR